MKNDINAVVAQLRGSVKVMAGKASLAPLAHDALYVLSVIEIDLHECKDKYKFQESYTGRIKI